MRLGAVRTEYAVLAIVMAVAIAFWTRSGSLAYPGNVFPRAVIIIVFVLACLNVFVKPKTSAPATVAGEEEQNSQAEKRARMSIYIGLGSVVAYFGGIMLIGFSPATFLYLAGLYQLKTEGEARTVRTVRGMAMHVAMRVSGAFLFTAFLYGVFTVLLGVQMPSGILGQ